MRRKGGAKIGKSILSSARAFARNPPFRFLVPSCLGGELSFSPPPRLPVHFSRRRFAATPPRW
jgi:hypothetical protein